MPVQSAYYKFTGKIDRRNPRNQGVTSAAFKDQSQSPFSVDYTSPYMRENWLARDNILKRPDGTEQALLPADPYTKLLLHFDNNLTDSSASAHTVTAVGGATTSSYQYEFGGYSAYMNGSGQYFTVPDSADWYFGTGDFTIDTWVRVSSFTNELGIC